MRKLNLANNLLREVPAPIVNFQLLTELNVSGNKLQVSDSSSSNNFVYILFILHFIQIIRTLRQYINIFLQVLTQQIGNLPSLTILNISSNELKELPSGILLNWVTDD